MKLFKAKCSQCGRVFRRRTRTDLLNAIRKHMWKLHADWMRRRIKRGVLKKRKADALSPADNPVWLKALLSGIFPPANIPTIVADYKAMTPEQKTTSKALIRSLTIPVGGEASAIAEVVIKALDMAVRP